jgi:catechol 2,3-dioxygenase-like lactoylglutathione lyase family enzyme
MRLNQVTLEVTDVPRAVEFYRGLGLVQIVGGDDRYARFVCPDPSRAWLWFPSESRTSASDFCSSRVGKEVSSPSMI